MRGDAGLVAGGGGEVRHVLVGGRGRGQGQLLLLLLLLNCRQILEHHLDQPDLPLIDRSTGSSSG